MDPHEYTVKNIIGWSWKENTMSYKVQLEGEMTDAELKATLAKQKSSTDLLTLFWANEKLKSDKEVVADDKDLRLTNIKHSRRSQNVSWSAALVDEEDKRRARSKSRQRQETAPKKVAKQRKAGQDGKPACNKENDGKTAENDEPVEGSKDDGNEVSGTKEEVGSTRGRSMKKKNSSVIGVIKKK